MPFINYSAPYPIAGLGNTDIGSDPEKITSYLTVVDGKLNLKCIMGKHNFR